MRKHCLACENGMTKQQVVDGAPFCSKCDNLYAFSPVDDITIVTIETYQKQLTTMQVLFEESNESS